MELIGISFLPVVWGFLAALAESVGALLLTVGFLTRTAALLLMGTMGMATTMHVMTGRGSPETAVIYLLVFTFFFLSGPGKYSADAIMGKRR
jgi:putative oxidoreductase